MAKKAINKKKISAKKGKKKGVKKPSITPLEKLYDIWCYNEKRFIARNKTAAQATKIRENHRPHATELQAAQSSLIAELTTNNSFEEQSDSGDFNEALSKAIQKAKDMLKTDFIQWELQKVSGQNGGFILENIIRVRIYAYVGK